MSRVFVMGPLAWTPLLSVILGHAQEGTEVDLNNVALGPSEAFPFPHIEDGAASTGLALELDQPEDFDALSYFASALGAHPVPKHGLAEGERVSGILFVAGDTLGATPTPPSMEMDAWVSTWGEIALRAAEEIMGYRGRVPARDLAWRMSMILSRATATLAAKAAQVPQVRSQTTRDDITVHAAHASHEGFFLTRSYDLQHTQFDGTPSARLRREVFVAADAVIVLPYDPVRDRVLLVEQFRMGPFARGDVYPWVLEPVAGRVDAGETVQAAAERECQEEASLTLHRLEHVTSHYCSPGASTEYYHCFVALADLPDEAQGLGGLETENEDIRTHILSFEDAMALLGTGEANIGPMILLLLWLERERPRLRAHA